MNVLESEQYPNTLFTFLTVKYKNKVKHKALTSVQNEKSSKTVQQVNVHLLVFNMYVARNLQ